MAENLAAQTVGVVRDAQHRSGRSGPGTVRIEAPTLPVAGSDDIDCAVVTTVRQLGLGGCAAAVADEYGEHPEIATARMVWALDVVRAVYSPLTIPAQPRGPLALGG